MHLVIDTHNAVAFPRSWLRPTKVILKRERPSTFPTYNVARESTIYIHTHTHTHLYIYIGVTWFSKYTTALTYESMHLDEACPSARDSMFMALPFKMILKDLFCKKKQNMHLDAASPSTRDLMYMRPSSFCWNTVLKSQRPSIMTINHYYNDD
jgi:hypothetical protein